MNAIEIKNLTKIYNDFSLDNLSLTLPSGCIMGLIGENGAGKSTTIKLILDMINRDGGEIKVLGRDNKKDFNITKEDIGVVPDEIGLPEYMNAYQVGKVMKLCYKNWSDEKYGALIEKLGLPMKKKFKEFSKGMKMKLGIAIALSHDPKLLILDEATSGLDPVVRDEVVGMFMEFTRDENHSVLISSHIVSDLEKICDYIAFLHKGRLMLCEEKDILKDEYSFVRGTREQILSIPDENSIGKKFTPYGGEAIVRRDSVPDGLEAGVVDIEQLFIFMVRKEGETEK